MTEEITEPKTHWYEKLSLLQALTIALVAASLIVIAASLLYWNHPNRKYDLARPGEKEDNNALEVNDEQADTTSPVDETAAKQKLEYLSKELKALEGLGQFNTEDLSNENIQLAPTQQPSL